MMFNCPERRSRRGRGQPAKRNGSAQVGIRCPQVKRDVPDEIGQEDGRCKRVVGDPQGRVRLARLVAQRWRERRSKDLKVSEQVGRIQHQHQQGRER